MAAGYQGPQTQLQVSTMSACHPPLPCQANLSGQCMNLPISVNSELTAKTLLKTHYSAAQSLK